MKAKKLIICFVIVTMLCTGGAVAWAASSGDGLITEPYEYPVVPGTNEWRTFRSHAQMVEACQIPEELLDRMTMEALLKSVAAYKSSKFASPIDRCLWLIEMDLRGTMEKNTPGLAL